MWAEEISLEPVSPPNPVLVRWGLWRYPFPYTPSLSSFIPFGTHGRVLDAALKVLDAGSQFLVVRGSRGTGKTCLISLLAQISGVDYVPACMFAVDHAGSGSIAALLVDDGDVQQVAFLRELSQQRNVPVVVTTRQFTALLCHRSCGRPPAEVVDLRPWTENEAIDALRLAVARAGADSNPFTRGAEVALARLSRGIPRRLARIANLSLVVAAGRDARQVTTRDVHSAASEVRDCCACAAGTGHGAA